MDFGRTAHRLPTKIETVEGDLFQVKGEEQVYKDPCEAMARSRELGGGSVVIRLSDSKVIATVPGYIPQAPIEWDLK